MVRKIIHIDMDAFFASVEQRDHPEWRGIPLAVGFDGPRGVVSTASYEARQYHIHSAMAIASAKRLCPFLKIVEPHFERYKEVSRQVHDIFLQYTDLVEPISIDEAFLDVTENKKGLEFARDIAMEIKQKIREKTHLTASAGVSYNKLLAKIASDYRKPDGLFVVHPDKALDFIAELPVEDFWGVGPKTAQKMHQMGIINGQQLRAVSRSYLMQVFGKAGSLYYDFARGIDNRPVVVEHERKSVGCEQTFLTDISLRSTVLIELYHMVLELTERIKKSGFEGRTLTLKVKFHDFTQITRSLTQGKQLHTKEEILPLAKQLLWEVDYERNPIRLLGLSVSNPANDKDWADSRPRWVEGMLDFKGFL
ncbi:MAG: DNA polymerase IV [Prevotella sp.]|jgi:DNA polymerase-4|nr:DNA polymerase IV [Prevotella sp.]MCI2081222.1 DNA polymerase IV [Prevotella sp.]MCI2103083.1 DNA polymerase IV [Prevotella sp.]